MQFQYDYQNETHSLVLNQIDAHRFKATIGEREIEFSAQQQMDGAWLLSIGNQRILAYVASEDDLRYVYVKGNTVTLSAIDERSQRRKQSGSAGDLTAQMPGQVVDVLVSKGDIVTAGQTLMILEAMKMEIRVTAPTEGTVNGVFVEKSDIVKRGQRLSEVS